MSNQLSEVGDRAVVSFGPARISGQGDQFFQSYTIIVPVWADGNLSTTETVDYMATATSDPRVVAESGTITFSATNRSDVLILFAIGSEFSEGVTLTLSNPSSGLVLGMESATFPDSSVPRLSIARSPRAEREGSDGTTAFTFALSLDQASTTAQSVSWSVAGVGPHAAEASDFAGPLSGKVEFAAGETSKTIEVLVAADAAEEFDEQFRVSLFGATDGLLLASDTADATIENDDMPNRPSDPLFPYQWFLENTGQSGGVIGSDINVLPVWADYTGEGVRVAIVDDGVQLLHPDLVDNVDLAESWDTTTNKQGGGPGPGQNHGTAVAGLVGEVANNGIGGSGVAPDATLISYRMAFGQGFTFAQPTLAFTRALAAGADVVNNSWGADLAFLQNAANPALAPFYDALNALGSEGRDGNGTIIVFANGNGGRPNYDSMLNNVLNSKYVIAVGAVENNGLQTQYSTPGANLLVSAPAGRSTNQADDRPGNGVLTTDRTSTDGYNKNAGADGDYAYNFNGTSAASPITSGVVALILDANPDLGYRDVQEILAHSARFVDMGGTAWTTTGTDTWNGGGALYSRLYGFGEVNAHGAVRLAEIYPFLHDAPRNDSNDAHATTTYTGVPLEYGPGGRAVLKFTLPDDIEINHVGLSVTAAIPDVDRTAMVLVSPSGTQITLFNQPPNAGQQPWPGTFTLGTNAFWGEQGAGQWILLAATSQDGQGGTVSGVTLDVYGNAPSPEKEFVYTDDFASIVTVDSWRGVADDRLGLSVRPDETAIINAVAVSGDVVVDLEARLAVITGETIAIAAGTRVTKVFTGDGDDRLVGDESANLLLAGRGTNTIDGGAGSDTLVFLGSRADYTATYSATGLFVAAAREGGTHDTATRVERAQFTEGTGYLPALSDTGLDVVALYTGLMFRDPDAGGYRYWTLEAAQGIGVTSIAANFLASTEFIDGAGKLGNAAFIEQTYLQLLDRSVDGGGLAYWDAELSSGALTRAGVVISIAHSEEYGTTQLGHVFGVLDALGNLWG